MNADATHKTHPAVNPALAKANGSDKIPVPMQVDDRLIMHDATEALPPTGGWSSRDSESIGTVGRTVHVAAVLVSREFLEPRTYP